MENKNKSIFTKIIEREIPAKIEYEDDLVVVIHDINPKSKTHLLIIPKRPIESIMSLQPEDQDLAGYLLLIAKKMGEKLGLEGYRLQFNVGKKGGQEIFHIHLHLLG